MNILDIAKSIGIREAIDIILMAILVYAILVWFKRKRAAFALWGILLSGGLYLLAYLLNLFLITYVLQAFFAVILIAVIVIFRDELRDLFEAFALWSINRNRKDRSTHLQEAKIVETLVRSSFDMARQKIGALIVIRGKSLLARYIEGGVELQGFASETILKSIFDPHSQGHDGAVILEDEHITWLGVHLPLTKNFKELEKKGTRHAAALGISEISDALALVISEERGTVSVAQNGTLKTIEDPEQLRNILEEFYQQLTPQTKRQSWKDFFQKNYREKAAALGIAVTLWFVLVIESKVIQKTFLIAVEYPELSSKWKVEKIDPPKVEVTFSGPRNSFHFVNENNIRLILKLNDPKAGIKKIPVTESNFNYPKEITLEDIDPKIVRVEMSEALPNGKLP